MAKVPEISRSTRTGEDFQTLAAGAYDLTALSGRPQRPIRWLWCPATATITVLKNAAGVDSPPGAVPALSEIKADISAITFSGGPIMVFW